MKNVKYSIAKCGNNEIPSKNRILLSDTQTIHSALDLKFGDYGHDPLSDQKLAQLRYLLSELKVIIIDEVSLLGSDLFYRIHRRVCVIFQSKMPFANLIVILVGDLLQVNNSRIVK